LKNTKNRKTMALEPNKRRLAWGGAHPQGGLKLRWSGKVPKPVQLGLAGGMPNEKIGEKQHPWKKSKKPVSKEMGRTTADSRRKAGKNPFRRGVNNALVSTVGGGKNEKKDKGWGAACAKVSLGRVESVWGGKLEGSVYGGAGRVSKKNGYQFCENQNGKKKEQEDDREGCGTKRAKKKPAAICKGSRGPARPAYQSQCKKKKKGKNEGLGVCVLLKSQGKRQN